MPTTVTVSFVIGKGTFGEPTLSKIVEPYPPTIRYFGSQTEVEAALRSAVSFHVRDFERIGYACIVKATLGGDGADIVVEIK